ncbi:MAG: tripartite tricarboxylate transporter permease [Propionibacteriales bacterium]|nr:tripartite tricarboxylate transporter permease [Propionibacteriales bacterium]
MLPGLGPVSAVAILFPLTTYLDPATGIIVLAAIYYGAMYGGSTSAILLNIPGEVSSVPAAIEGFALTRKGRGGAALAMAAITSFMAGIVGTLGVVIIGPYLADLALEFGPPERLGLVLFSLTAIAGLSGGSVPKALAMGALGMILASIGLDQTSGQPRLTFGSLTLLQGLDIVPVMMGLFGLAEVIRTLRTGAPTLSSGRIGRLMPNRDEFTRGSAAGARGTALGFSLGVLPGMLPSVTAFLNYASERRRAERRGRTDFGRGAIEGVSGPEATNNAAAMSGFIPLFSLGIPTGPTMALIMAALLVYGLVPGPELFTTESSFTATVIASFFVANIILLFLNLPLVPLWARLAQVPYGLLAPIIIFCCLTGAYLTRNNFFDVWVCLIFGVVGWAMSTWRLPVAPLVMGFILGPMLEIAARQSIAMSGTFFLERPVFILFVVAAITSVALSRRLRRTDAASAQVDA